MIYYLFFRGHSSALQVLLQAQIRLRIMMISTTSNYVKSFRINLTETYLKISLTSNYVIFLLSLQCLLCFSFLTSGLEISVETSNDCFLVLSEKMSNDCFLGAMYAGLMLNDCFLGAMYDCPGFMFMIT